MKVFKPTFGEILELRDKLKNEDYAQLHQEFLTDDAYYELDIKRLLGVPDQFFDDASVLPTSRQLIDVYTDHVDLANARVTVGNKQVDPDNAHAVKAAEEESDMLAKFGRGLLYRALVEEDVSQLRIAAKHQGLYGLGCLKTVYDADRWADKPEQKDTEGRGEYEERIDEWRHQRDSQMPIVIQAVNPATLYPDPSYGGRQFVIEERERVCLDIRMMFPRWTNPKSKRSGEKVTLSSYWDSNYRCDFADDEPLFSKGVLKHNYGFIPYVFIESGLGNMSIDGSFVKRYVGLLRYLRDVLVSESRNFSLYDVAMKKGALPFYTAEGSGADQITWNTDYGEVTAIPPGVKVEQRFPDLAPDAVMRQVEIINSIISAFGAPRAVQGLGDAGVRSAAHARTLADLGGVKFQYPSEAFRNKVAKVLSNCALLYKNVIPDDMRLWARTPTDEFDTVIEKKKLHPPFTFYVEFAPYSEEKEYVKYEALMKLVQSGIASIKWARKQVPNIDWKQMEIDDHKQIVAADSNVQSQLGSIRAAMIQDAIERRMIAEDIKSLPRIPAMNPVSRGSSLPNGMASPNILSQSTPQALPGSAGDIQNRMDASVPQMPEMPQ